MLWTIAAILFILWIIGLATGTVVHGLVWILLALAVIIVIIRLLTGSRAV